jgi:phage-related protein
MAISAEELIVAIRSEGVGETQEDLEGVERQMEDTAESAGESADELEGFSERFQGAMGAAVAALAVGAAGLLSQVPVLGELFSGLAAVVSAVAFQMDGVLRPVLSPLTGLFFELSSAIFEANGIIGDIIGAVAAVVSIATVLIGVAAKVGAVLGIWASAGAGVVSILGTIAGVIGTVIGTIVSLPALLVAAVAAIAAFAVAYLTNFRGIRDKTNQFIGNIVDTVVGGVTDFAAAALKAVKKWVGNVGDWFTDLASDLSSWASDVASDAFEWGADLVKGLLEGIRAFAGLVVEAFQGVINGIIETINTALDTLPDEVTSTVGVESFERVDFAADFGRQTTGGGGGGGTPAGRPPAGGVSGVQLDGRDVSEQTGRYRADPGRRRGL